MLLNTPYSKSNFNIDLLVYANLISTGAVDLTALRAEVYKTAREKLCSTKKSNKLSRLVSADYAIQYAEAINLANDEELIEIDSEEYTGYDLEDISSKWFIPTEEELTTLRQELDALRKLVPDLEVSSSQVESTFNSTVKDGSSIVSDEELSDFFEDSNLCVFEDDLFFEDIYENLQVDMPEYTVESLSYEYNVTDADCLSDTDDYYSTLEYSDDSLSEDYNIESNIDEYDSEELKVGDESGTYTEFDAYSDDSGMQDNTDEEVSHVRADSEEGLNEAICDGVWEDEFFSSETLNYTVISKPDIAPEPAIIAKSTPSVAPQRKEKQKIGSSPSQQTKPHRDAILEKSSTQKESLGTTDEEPKDLREFLRKHPNCEIATVYQYFTKKEVQKALLTGRVIKKGNKLRI